MEKKLTFIDFETTGFSQNRAVSLGIIYYEKSIRKFEKYYLINPDALIEPGAMRVHSITYDMVKEKPLFKDIWGEIRPYIEGSIVVAHNARFDVGVLLGELKRYNLECGEFWYFCTCSNARALHLPIKSHSLDSLCSYFNIDLQNHHNALADTRACESLYFNLIKTGCSFKITKCCGVKSY